MFERLLRLHVGTSFREKLQSCSCILKQTGLRSSRGGETHLWFVKYFGGRSARRRAARSGLPRRRREAHNCSPYLGTWTRENCAKRNKNKRNIKTQRFNCETGLKQTARKNSWCKIFIDFRARTHFGMRLNISIYWCKYVCCCIVISRGSASAQYVSVRTFCRPVVLCWWASCFEANARSTLRPSPTDSAQESCPKTLQNYTSWIKKYSPTC